MKGSWSQTFLMWQGVGLIEDARRQTPRDTSKQGGERPNADGEAAAVQLSRDGSDCFGLLCYRQPLWRVACFSAAALL